MFAKDYLDDRSWSTHQEIVPIGKCKCGKGKIEEVYLVASHEKVSRVEKDFIRKQLNCSNPNCPSRNTY